VILEEDLSEQQKTDYDFIKEAASFAKRAGNFNTVLILATKDGAEGFSERFQHCDGNVFAGIGLAELYLNDKFNEED